MFGNGDHSKSALRSSSNSSTSNIFDCSFSSTSSSAYTSFDDDQEFPKKASPQNSSSSSSTSFLASVSSSSSAVPGGYKISKKSSNSSLFSNNSSSSSISSTASNNVNANNASLTSLSVNTNISSNSHSRSNSIHKNSTKKNRSNSFFLSPSLSCKLQHTISSITSNSGSAVAVGAAAAAAAFDYSDLDDLDSSTNNDNFFDTPSSSSSSSKSSSTTAPIMYNGDPYNPISRSTSNSNNQYGDDEDVNSLLSNADDNDDISEDLSSPLQKRNKSARRTQSMFLKRHISSTNTSFTNATSTTNTTSTTKTLRTSASVIYSSDYSILENKNDNLNKANLPFFHIKEDSVPRINPATMHDILKGRYADKFPDVKIIDCRFDYEFIGGHVQGAVNINSQQRLHEYFFNEKIIKSSAGATDSLIVFHCEFSQFRGPKMAETLRRFDRQINKENYPNLHYPNLVVLSGGYKDFFKESPQQCIPRNYITMNDERYTLKCSVEMERFQSCLKKKASNSQLYCTSSSFSSATKRSPGFLSSHLRTYSCNSNSLLNGSINAGISASANVATSSDWMTMSKKRSSSSLRAHKRHNTVNSAFFPALKAANSFCTSSSFLFSNKNNEDASDDIMASEKPQRVFFPKLTRKSAMLSLSSSIMMSNNPNQMANNENRHNVDDDGDDDDDDEEDDDDDLDDLDVINDSNLMMRDDLHHRRPSISRIPDEDKDTENFNVFNPDHNSNGTGGIISMKMAGSIALASLGSNNNQKSGITASSSTSTIVGDEEMHESICGNKHGEQGNCVSLQDGDDNNEDDDMLEYRFSGEERDSPVSNIFGVY